MAILGKVLQTAVKFNASDIHVVPDEPIILRRLVKLKSKPLTAGQTREIVFEVLSGDQRAQLLRDRQLDFAVDRDASAVSGAAP